MPQLPNSLLAETRILSGAIGSDRLFFAALERLEPQHFYAEIHQNIFSVMSRERTHELVRVTTMVPEFPFEILENDCSYTGEAEINQIIDCYTRRRALTMLYNAINEFSHDFERSAEEISGSLISNLINGTPANDKRPQHFKELIPAAITHIENVKLGKDAAAIKTGLIDLDEAVSIQQHDYIIIGASPSMGKSTVTGAIARHVARTSGNVLLFTLESSNRHELMRSIFAEAHVSLHQFNLGTLPAGQYPALARSAAVLDKVPVFLDDDTPLTPAKLYAKAQRIRAEFGPIALIIVDFLQLMDADRRIDDPRERTNAVSSGLKRICKRIDCPLIANSQLARYKNQETAPPQRHFLRESGSLEQDADTVLLLYRPEYYRPTADNTNILDLYIAKQRDGRVGKIQLTFLAEYMQVENLAKQTPTAEQPWWSK